MAVPTPVPPLSCRVYDYPLSRLNDMAFTADGSTLLVVGHGNVHGGCAVVHTIDMASGAMALSRGLPYPTATSVTRIADATFAVGVHGDSLCIVVPGDSVQHVQHVPWGTPGVMVRTDLLVANRSGTKLARAVREGRDMDVMSIDRASGVVSERLPLQHASAVTAVAWSPEHDDVLVTGADDALSLRDTRAGDGGQLAASCNTAPISSLAYDPRSGGNIIAVGHEDGCVSRLDLRKLEIGPLPPWPFTPHSSFGCRPNVGVQYSPCGTMLATTAATGVGCGCGLIKLWDTAPTQLLQHGGDVHTHILRGHKGTIARTLFTPVDRSQLLSCSHDGKVIAWDLTEARPPRAGEMTKAARRAPGAPE